MFDLFKSLACSQKLQKKTIQIFIIPGLPISYQDSPAFQGVPFALP